MRNHALDASLGSDPYINLDKTAGGDLAERVDLTPMGAKTRIELDRYK
jgi:hypothetical protein